MDSRFTPEENLTRWEQQREIKNMIVRMISQDYLFRRENQGYQRYWSAREDVSLGVNNGYYVGKKAVQAYYQGLEDQTKLESSLIKGKYPTRLGEKTDTELYGVGVLRYKALEIPVIEIAADGQTAKALYHVHGSNTRLTTGGQTAYWERSYLAFDLCMEDGAWKVWHMLYLRDVDHPCGAKWDDPEPAYAEDPAYQELKDFRFPEPNVPMSVHELYSAHRRFSPPPEYPVPYDTFSETFSYGYPGKEAVQ